MNENRNMIALPDRKNHKTRLWGGTPVSALVASAQKELAEDPLFRGSSQLIRIHECDGTLVLEGRLPSFYLKQLLQTMLQKLDGVDHIDNRVHVDYPPRMFRRSSK